MKTTIILLFGLSINLGFGQQCIEATNDDLSTTVETKNNLTSPNNIDEVKETKVAVINDLDQDNSDVSLISLFNAIEIVDEKGNRLIANRVENR